MFEQFFRHRRSLSSAFFAGIALLVGVGVSSASTVDTAFLVSADFDTYDMEMKVRSIVENTDAYSIEYAYETVEAVNAVWQRVSKTASMQVSKQELGERDLGLYVASQLDQITDQQIEYLKAVQKEERKDGEAESSISAEYAGLIGQPLNSEEQTFEGYEPVKPPVAETISVATNDERVMGVSEGTVSETVSEVAPVAISESDSSSDTSALDVLASKIASLEEKLQVLTQLVDTLTEFYTTFNLASLLGKDGA